MAMTHLVVQATGVVGAKRMSEYGGQRKWTAEIATLSGILKVALPPERVEEFPEPDQPVTIRCSVRERNIASGNFGSKVWVVDELVDFTRPDAPRNAEPRRPPTA